MVSLWTLALLGWFSVGGVQWGLRAHVPLAGYDLLFGYGAFTALYASPMGLGIQPGVALQLDAFSGEDRYRVDLWALGPMIHVPVAQAALEMGIGGGQLGRRMGQGQERGVIWNLWGRVTYPLFRWTGAETALGVGYQGIPGKTRWFQTLSLEWTLRWHPSTGL